MSTRTSSCERISSPSRRPRRCLLVVTGVRVGPDVLETAIARANAGHDRLHVVIPAVVPATLPMSAMPGEMAARLNGLRRVAAESFRRLGAQGRIDVVRGRNVRSIMRAAAPQRVDGVVFAGTAGWLLRRAARGMAPVTVVGAGGGRRRDVARTRVLVTDAAAPLYHGSHEEPR